MWLGDTYRSRYRGGLDSLWDSHFDNTGKILVSSLVSTIGACGANEGGVNK